MASHITKKTAGKLKVAPASDIGRTKRPRRTVRAVDLKVTLLLCGKNAVRCLRVPLDITFESLHHVLQSAFEWENDHLYSFDFYWNDPRKRSARPILRLHCDEETADMNDMFGGGSTFYSSIDDDENYDDDDDVDVEIGCVKKKATVSNAKLKDLIGQYPYIVYVYDFGDDWNHVIKVENIIEDCDEKLPRLLSGSGDSPPEDIGGVYGFKEFLEIIADPEDERHEEMCEWGWEPFDFDRVAWRVESRG